MLLWTFVHKAFCAPMFSLLLSKHLGVWSHTVTLCLRKFSSITQSYPALCDPVDRSTTGLPVHQQLPEFTQTHVHWVGDAIQPSHSLSFPSSPALNLSQHQGLFKWVSSSYQWPKYWSFGFNIGPSNEHPGLISFRMDWLDILAVQGTLNSLLQHHSSKASILQHSAFFIVQFLHPYMTTGKTKALTGWTFVDKVMSLLFNMLSRWVITFFPRSKCLLITGCNHHLQWLYSRNYTFQPHPISCVYVGPFEYRCQKYNGTHSSVLIWKIPWTKEPHRL